jgi:hypothetical protein
MVAASTKFSFFLTTPNRTPTEIREDDFINFHQDSFLDSSLVSFPQNFLNHKSIPYFENIQNLQENHLL